LGNYSWHSPYVERIESHLVIKGEVGFVDGGHLDLKALDNGASSQTIYIKRLKSVDIEILAAALSKSESLLKTVSVSERSWLPFKGPSQDFRN
jgi:hypothetical protein